MIVYRGFTLIELLIVIVIISILAGLLFPVFARVREKGRQSACMNNQRQIVMAIQMNAHDNEEKMPDAGKVWSAINLPAGTLLCQSSATQANSYVYNNFVANTSLAKIADASEMPLTIDGRHQESTVPATYANVAYTAADIVYRHDKTVIVGYCDGHVKRVPSVDLIPGLQAQLGCDEMTGVTVDDDSGHACTGTLNNNMTWVAGKTGGALHGDGISSYVSLADSTTLNSLHQGSYTLSVWFDPDDTPSGTSLDANDGAYALLMKSGASLGLRYNHAGTVSFIHECGGQEVSVTSSTSLTIGAWSLITGVVNSGQRTLLLYINGSQARYLDLSATAPPYDSGTSPWYIGIANPGAAQTQWCARGAFDDVRLYNRAVTPAEISAMCP